MDPEREEHLADLLLEAFSRPPAEREGFFEQACGDDCELLAEAQQCLLMEDELGDFLERPAGDPVAAVAVAPEDLGSPVSGRDELLDKGRLGAYRVVGPLGEGGMSRVYVAEDERLGRRVAVKILPPEMAGHADWLRRFKREARALAALNHPNIVTIHSIEQDGGVHFLTMELVSGKTLDERIEEGPLRVADLLRIGLEMSGALGAAHRRGVVHRDLKPANVMINDDGRVKILDFGIAKLLKPDIGTMSTGVVVLGTVGYMSPEQLEGKPVDARSDVFALGVALFLMATGEHPFPTTNPVERIQAILYEPAPDVLDLRPDLPPELAAIIARCLEKSPQGRYPDAEALHRDLRGLQDDLLTETIRVRAQSQPESARRRPWARWLLPLVTVVGLAALALPFTVQKRLPATPAIDVAVTPRAETVLAVLPFRNLTGDAELEWLSVGIAELLRTDLGQSSDIQVLSRAQTRRLLSKAEIGDGGELDPSAVRALAERMDLGVVVRCSFTRQDDALRIVCLLDDPLTGNVLQSVSFETSREESPLGLIDEISLAIRDGIGIPRPDSAQTTGERSPLEALSPPAE